MTHSRVHDSVSRRAKRPKALTLLAPLILLSLVLLPRPHVVYAGVTNEYVGPHTYTVALALAVLLLWKNGALLPRLHGMLLFYLAAGLFALWSAGQMQVAGAIHYASAVVALWAGRELGRRGMTRGLLPAIALVSAVEVAIVAVQVYLNPTAFLRGAGGAIYRVTGTTPHPGTLGKAAFLLLILTLPYLTSRSRERRLTAGVCIFAQSALILLSLGRANMAALALTLVAWSVLVPGVRSLRKRFGLLVLVALICVPLLPALTERAALDPDGGARPELLGAALRQIVLTPIVGVGPNSYVDVVGSADAVTALGYPVHNAFLLVAAEIGILGAVLLLTPLVAVVCRASIALRQRDEPALWSRALIIGLPGLLVIAVTGWGIIGGPLLPLTFFVFGLMDGVRGSQDGVGPGGEGLRVPVERHPGRERWSVR